MNFHVFGDKSKPKILLIHGMQAPWQVWDETIREFNRKYCVIAVALDAHEEERKSEFLSIKDETKQIEQYYIRNFGTQVYAICGLSLGGIIAAEVWKRDKIHSQKIIMDGAPLVPYGAFVKNVLTKAYLQIAHSAQKRNRFMINRVVKRFLPGQYMRQYYRIIDKMSDNSIRNMVSSMADSYLCEDMIDDGNNVLYLYGTKLSELLSKRTVKRFVKYHPKATVYCFRKSAHCYTAFFRPSIWLKKVKRFLA